MEKKLEFYGGTYVALVPFLVFIGAMITMQFLGVSLRMHVIYSLTFIAMVACTVLSKGWDSYWDAIMESMTNKLGIMLVVVLLTVGLFAQMLRASGISYSFVWLGAKIGISGNVFVVATFLISCLIGVSTGTSIGTMTAVYPILLPAGVVLGGHPLLLAGAIFGGAIFGDNLAPISDTTIASANTQTYANKSGPPDIAGVVGSRLRYSLVAAGITMIFLFIFGQSRELLNVGVETFTHPAMGPKAFLMLIPIAVMLVIAFKTRSIFKALIWGTIIGTAIGLISGIFKPADVFGINEDNILVGYLYDGIRGKVDICITLLIMFGFTGILRASGVLDRILELLAKSRLSRTVIGNEVLIAIGIILASVLVRGSTGVSIILFGPMGDQIGKQKNLHPYRTANLIDGFANTIPVINPVASGLLFIAVSIIGGVAEQYAFLNVVDPFQLAAFSFYPMALFVVLCLAVLTGWGRRYEGPAGEPIKHHGAKRTKNI